MTEHKKQLTPADHVVVRPGTDDDLVAINDIYNHYVVSTPITFDIEPSSMSQRRDWMERYALTGRHRLFVAEGGGAVVGYAGSHQFHQKPAYYTTVETTVYCAPDATGRGVGRALYQALFDSIRGEDVHVAMAGITLPNAASIGLHEKFGFTAAGVMHDVGRKFYRYWDVGWYEKLLP